MSHRGHKRLRPGDGVTETAQLFFELGRIFALLAFMARLATPLPIPPIRLYHLDGLIFGRGRLVPLVVGGVR